MIVLIWDGEAMAPLTPLDPLLMIVQFECFNMPTNNFELTVSTCSSKKTEIEAELNTNGERREKLFN